MADTKISGLTDGAPLVGSDIAPFARGAGNVRGTITNLKTFLSANLFNQTLNTTDNVTFNSITTTATTSQFNGLTSTGQLLVNRNNVNSIVAQGTGEQLIVRARVSGGNTFMAFKTFDNIRRGFFGFGGSSSPDFQLMNQEAGSMAFGTNNIERMTILSNGNITTTGSLTAGTDMAVSGNYGFLATSTTPALGVATHAPLSNTMAFITGSTERMRITALGRVGIGKPSPAVELDVAGSIIADGSVTAGGDVTATGNLRASGNFEFLAVTATPAVGAGMHAPAGDTLAIVTNDTERMRIDSIGRVGIGKTPAVALDVVGAITSSTTLTAGTNLVGDVFQISSSTSTPAIVAGMHAPASFTLGLITNSLERMRISSSGNVGIGTTNPVANTVAGVTLLSLANAATVPTGTVTNAGILYMDNGQLHNLDSAGADHNLTSASALLISTADVVVANTITETSLLEAGAGSKAIPATRMVVGAKFKLKAQGFMSTVSNPSANFRFKIGGLEKAATGSQPLGNFTNEHFELDVEMVIRTEGTSGTAVVSGKFIDQMGDHLGIVNMGTIAINTTVTANFDLTVQWSVANAANTLTSQIAEIEELRV